MTFCFDNKLISDQSFQHKVEWKGTNHDKTFSWGWPCDTDHATHL